MKKNRFTILFALVLAVVAIYFVVSRKSGTIRKELMDFAVKDTAAITKIFLADRSGNTVKLERKEPHNWSVNDSFIADKTALKNLLQAIGKVDIRARVAKPAYNNVIKNLSATGIKCEIYLRGNKDPDKVYYVGDHTADDLGTYMMLENSSVPFITEVPGFNGYLTPRYTANIKSWKQRFIFPRPASDIKMVTMTYLSIPEKSFRIERNGNSYRVQSPVTNEVIVHPDSIAIDNYLGNFRLLSFEGWDSELKKNQVDSLLSTSPIAVLSVTLADNKEIKMSLYPKTITASSLVRTDTLGNPLRFDPDRMYGYLHASHELVTIQHFVFDVAFLQLRDFDLAVKQRAHRSGS